MVLPKKDLYRILGVPFNATQEQIKQAYRALVRRYHPDSGTEDASAARFREIHDAYTVLSNPARRQAYDRWWSERYPGGTAVFTWEVLTSRKQLPLIVEEQMLYVLINIRSGQKAKEHRLPLNLALVIDRSTSMQGDRLDYVKAAAHQIIEELEDHDVLSVVTFSDRAEVVVPSQHLKNRARIHTHISAIWTSGGTEILRGLRAGLEQVRRFHTDDVISHLILLTDGRTYGDEEECIAEARRAGLQRIGISALGIGEDWNDTFLEEMTRQAGGTCSYIPHPRQIRHVLQEQVRGLGAIAVRDLLLTLRLSEGVRLDSAFRCAPYIERLLVQKGEINLGLLQGNTPIQILLELVVAPQPEGKQRLVQLELSGSVPVSGERERLVFDLQAEFTGEPEEQPVPTVIINVLNRINLFRMQEMAWNALEEGRREEAHRRLEAVATRLLNMGERELAHIALLEAGRIAQGGQASKKGHKTIKYGTRALGLKR